MNPIVLRIILSLAPSINRLLIALLDRWLEERHKRQSALPDPAADAAVTLVEALKIENLGKKETTDAKVV